MMMLVRLTPTEFFYSHDVSALAASLSTHIIKVYHPTSGDFLGQLQGHTDTVHEIGFPDPASPHLLVSCSSDGTVREWDLRSFSQVRSKFTSCIRAC